MIYFTSRFLPKILAASSRPAIWPEHFWILFGKQVNSCNLGKTALLGCAIAARTGFVSWAALGPHCTMCLGWGWSNTPHTPCTTHRWVVKGANISWKHIKNRDVIYRFRQTMSFCLLVYKKSNSSKVSSKERGKNYWATISFLVFVVGNLLVRKMLP